jgi:cobalt/nickel transport system permease protein
VSKRQRTILTLLTVLLVATAAAPGVSAMHIMEGYLPPALCAVWGVVCLPFLVIGAGRIKAKVGEQNQNLLLLALCGAFVFVISSLKIPSVTASCSHMTGTGLGAILFGPAATSVLGLIVLVFQALLLAHGGLTTLGANCFSMAVAGPLAAYVLYKGLQAAKVNRRVSVFLAAFLGDLFTYCVTSVQLAVAHPAPEGGVGTALVKFLGVFAPTQLPLAVVEGILTVVIVIALETYASRELRAVGYLGGNEI